MTTWQTFAATLVGIVAILSFASIVIADNAGRAIYATECVASGAQFISWQCVR